VRVQHHDHRCALWQHKIELPSDVDTQFSDWGRDLAAPGFVLSQPTRTQFGQSEYRTRRSTTSGGVPWFVVPLHEIGAYQRSYHAGIQMRGSTAGTSAKIG